jgi:hypothetical protein
MANHRHTTSQIERRSGRLGAMARRTTGYLDKERAETSSGSPNKPIILLFAV